MNTTCKTPLNKIRSCNGEKTLGCGKYYTYEGLIITEEDIVAKAILRKVINVSAIKYITYINFSTSSEIICPETSRPPTNKII